MEIHGRETSPEQMFHPFKRLPSEIRCQIWRATLRPRVVEIHALPLTEPGGRILCTEARLPTALRVSKDSRDAVLQLYPHLLSSLLIHPALRFNFAIDTLYFPFGAEKWMLPVLATLVSDGSNLQHLAIAQLLFDGDEATFWFTLHSVLLRLASLQTFIITEELWGLVCGTYCTKENYEKNCNESNSIEFFEEVPKELLDDKALGITASVSRQGRFRYMSYWRDITPQLLWSWRFKRALRY